MNCTTAENMEPLNKSKKINAFVQRGKPYNRRKRNTYVHAYYVMRECNTAYETRKKNHKPTRQHLAPYAPRSLRESGAGARGLQGPATPGREPPPAPGAARRPRRRFPARGTPRRWLGNGLAGSDSSSRASPALPLPRLPGEIAEHLPVSRGGPPDKCFRYRL